MKGDETTVTIQHQSEMSSDMCGIWIWILQI